MKYLSVSALGVLLAACATPATDIPRIPQANIEAATPTVQEATVDAHLARLDRANKIVWPMLVANSDLCHKRRIVSFGMRFGNDKTIRGLVDGFTLKQVRALGYSETPIVLGVQDASPAALAGLKPGAVPIKVGDTDIDGDMRALTKALSAYQKARGEAKDDGGSLGELEALTFVFEQADGSSLETALEPVTVCNIPVKVPEIDIVNAQANGKEIRIFRGLLNHFDDDQVGFVAAHEIGHVVGRHVPKQRRNALVSGYQVWGIPVILGAGLFDSFFAGPLEQLAGVERAPGQQAVTLLGNRILGTREFEREADYLGMYIAARSGLDITKSENVFADLAELSARSTYGENSHPVTADRMLALAAARQEIKVKQSANEALVPNGWPFPLSDDEVDQ